jgi:diaminopimelate epimerase
MNVPFYKYHALGNDFLIVVGTKLPSPQVAGGLAIAICDRSTGVGADGLLYLSPSRKADIRADVFNADGSWAEISGNGIRIVALHLRNTRNKKSVYRIEMGHTTNEVKLLTKIADGYMIRAEIGAPDFRAKSVPIKARTQHVINQKLRIGSEQIRGTCLSVGNPHCVVPVDTFDFDWKALGQQIEHAPIFPKRTNVEFVRIANRSKIEVAEWERGAGATGSSGTGAAAAVAAMVMLGLVDRQCEVVFDPGSLFVNWRSDNDTIELHGPVVFVASGTFQYR